MKKYIRCLKNSFYIVTLSGLILINSGCSSVISRESLHGKKTQEESGNSQSSAGNAGLKSVSAPSYAPSPEKSKGSGVAENDNIAVQIADKSISREAFNTGYQKFLVENSLMDNSESKERYLNRVCDELLMRHYAAEKKLEEDVEFVKQFEAFKSEFVVNYVKNNLIMSRVQVSYAEIESYYNSNKSKYADPEKVQVRFILTNTQSEADRAMKRLKNGEDFKKVAGEMSIHSSKSNGGELPPFARGSYNAAFEEASFNLKVGELSEVIKTNPGYNIIEKTGEYPAKIIPLENVKGEISKILLEKKENEALSDFLSNMRKDVTIKIYPEAQEAGNR